MRGEAKDKMHALLSIIMSTYKNHYKASSKSKRCTFFIYMG